MDKLLAQCTDLGLVTSQNINEFNPHTIEACFNYNAHVKKINQANKPIIIKGMDLILGYGDITMPKSCLKMAQIMLANDTVISGKYWLNMIDFEFAPLCF